MNDTYVECLVAKKQNPLFTVLKGVIIAACIFCVLLGFSLGNQLFMLLGIAGGFLSFYLLFPMFSIEYEYLYLDKEITIDKIMSKQKRKRAEVLDLSKMELLAPADSHEMDNYLSRKVPIKDYSSGIEGHKAYYLVYHDEKEEALYKLEPDEEMLNAIRYIAPRKVKG